MASSRNQLSESRWATKSKVPRAFFPSAQNNCHNNLVYRPGDVAATVQCDAQIRAIPTARDLVEHATTPTGTGQTLPPHLRKVFSPAIKLNAAESLPTQRNVNEVPDNIVENQVSQVIATCSEPNHEESSSHLGGIQKLNGVSLHFPPRSSDPIAEPNLKDISNHGGGASNDVENASARCYEDKVVPYSAQKLPPHLRKPEVRRNESYIANTIRKHNDDEVPQSRRDPPETFSAISNHGSEDKSKDPKPVEKMATHIRNFYVKHDPRYIGLKSQNDEPCRTLDEEAPSIGKEFVLQSSSFSKSPEKLTTSALHVISSQQEHDLPVRDTSTSPDDGTHGSLMPSIEKSLVFESVKKDPYTTLKDIRGQEPRETWDNQDWDATRRNRPKRKDWDSETPLSDGSGASSRSAYAPPVTFLDRFVESWRDAIPRVQGPLLGVLAINSGIGSNDADSSGGVFERLGIDPVTGKFMGPIEEPLVDKNNNEVYDMDLREKCEQQTAQWSTDRWLGIMKRRDDQRNEREKHNEYHRQLREMDEEKTKKGNPFLCRIPAHLRPATEADMEDVTRIYNQEVRDGYRALDQDPQPVEAFRDFLRTCRSEKVPFLVAMSKYRNPNEPVDQAGHQVVGFAFLVVASRGLFGASRSNGKHSARMYVMVDPVFRRERVGTALIDRMLILTSRGYMEKENAYQFINPSNDPVYRSELYNPRQWLVILMEIFIKNLSNITTTKAGDEYTHLVEWLELDFDIEMVRHTSKYGIADCRGGAYLDRLLFEHRCKCKDGVFGLED